MCLTVLIYIAYKCSVELRSINDMGKKSKAHCHLAGNDELYWKSNGRGLYTLLHGAKDMFEC